MSCLPSIPEEMERLRQERNEADFAAELDKLIADDERQRDAQDAHETEHVDE